MTAVRDAFSVVRTFLVFAALAGCGQGYDVLQDGQYECTATLVSTTCGPDLPTSTSVVDVQVGGGVLSIVAPGLPSPLDPTTMPGSSILFGVQDDGMTYHSTATRTCMTDASAQLAMDTLAILVAFEEASFEYRMIQSYSGLSSCDVVGASVDSCRAERLVECQAL